jgi:hypothetical protein
MTGIQLVVGVVILIAVIGVYSFIIKEQNDYALLLKELRDMREQISSLEASRTSSVDELNDLRQVVINFEDTYKQEKVMTNSRMVKLNTHLLAHDKLIASKAQRRGEHIAHSFDTPISVQIIEPPKAQAKPKVKAKELAQ